MKMNLTDLAIRALKPSDSQMTVWDSSLAGFGVRVGKRRKTYIAMRGETRERVTIGHYPDLSLQDARRKAKLILGSPALPPPSQLTFESALTTFLDTHCIHLRRRTRAEMERLLRRHFAFEKALAKITRRDVQGILDRLTATPSEAIHAFKAIRTFFLWSHRRGDIDVNPIAGMSMPAKERTRDRVLTPQELKAIWHAAADHPFGTIIRLLILTGQRRSEIQHASLDGEIATIAAKYVKNGRAHSFPVGDMAKSLLAANLEFNGWSKAKARLDRIIAISHWTLHDLRRTYATIHASIGTPPHIIERLLNHVSGTISGVAAIYNRFQYANEMHAAVITYEAHIAKLIEG
jgi:integrase